MSEEFREITGLIVLIFLAIVGVLGAFAVGIGLIIYAMRLALGY